MATTRDYPTFRAFMEEVILPMKSARPEDVRLDGQPTGGNLEVVGVFMHGGRRWKVHGDTRYRQLLIAYEGLRTGDLDDPFVEQPTKRGMCLELAPSLRALTGDRHKHLYIYGA